MQHDIKTLSEAITNHTISDLILTNVKELRFENNHLTVFVDNAGALHTLESEEGDHHLKNGLEKVYGKDITYEIKLFKADGTHEREKNIPHSIH
jgi:hypothetical protein